MAPWLFSAAWATFAMGLHYLFLRAASGKIGDALGALILEGTAGSGILLMMALGVRTNDTPTTRLGVVFSILAGLCISAFTVLLYGALRKGGPASTTGMFVFGGGVVLSAALAPVVFREELTLRKGVGLALGAVSLFLLAGTDKG